MKTAQGYFNDDDDMSWVVNCPDCDAEIEYEGFYDSSDVTKCKCGCEFTTSCVYFSNGNFVK